MFSRWKKIVIDNYGISEDNAHWVIDFWFSEYGVAVCNNTYIKPTTESQTNKPQKKENQSTPLKKPSATDGFVDVSKMQDGDKIPKNMVEIININDKDVKISTINCTVRKDYDISGATAIKFAGEYSGKSDKYVLIFIMLYNADNELINYESHIGISEGFSGQGSFSETVTIPNDEFISRAVVRLVLNPVFV